MGAVKGLRYRFMKDLGAPLLMGIAGLRRKRRPKKPNPDMGPPLRCNARLMEIMSRHYFLSRYVRPAMPVAWVTSGAPVELLRAFDFYTIYPENHAALCGAQKMGSGLCVKAEEKGYNQDLCSYARVDLGHVFSGKTPIGRLPKPDLLFCSNNICQTVVYWYRVLAHHFNVPLILFDTPYMNENQPFESMARAYSLVILNNNLNHRLGLMERLIEEFKVDGLVIHSAKSCKPYSVGQYDIKRLLTARLGLPSVVIEADIADARAYSEEQTRNRLEAFFDMMKT